MFLIKLLKKYCVYIIHSSIIDRFYIGETRNFEDRLEQHNSGFYSNAYTKKTQDWEKYLLIHCENKSQALKIEKHIKKMKSITYIKNLIKYPDIILKLKEKYK